MIFDRPYFVGETYGAQDRYVQEIRDRSLTNVRNLDKRPTKQFKGKNDNHHPHCDALVITVMMPTITCT